jgi:hypothetical protein
MGSNYNESIEVRMIEAESNVKKIVETHTYSHRLEAQRFSRLGGIAGRIGIGRRIHVQVEE